jgi:hypothetical protein
VLINNGEQFTTNLTVDLTLSAVDDGTGVVQMQFSNDEESWSDPEPYQSTKEWLLAGGTYPPAMSTVLKTVYVRFQDGAGNWASPVSDSIVYARTGQDVPQIQEEWIAQKAPTNFDGTQPPGSEQNPWLIPVTNNEGAFDTLLYSLMTNFGDYVTQGASATGWPGPATNMTTLTLHIGAGTYETHGACRGWGDHVAWAPRNGWRILGAGKDFTTLKAVNHLPGYTNDMMIIGGYYGNVASYDNMEIADMTLDANLHEGETNYQDRYSGCIWVHGSNLQFRRVRNKNFGTTIPNCEGVGGLGLQNPGSIYGDFNVIIEDCEVVQAQVNNTYSTGMMGVMGNYGANGKLLYYQNVMVRNCYVDGAAYDGDVPVDPMSYSCYNRGRFAIGITGCSNAVIEDNLMMNVVDSFYLDSVGLHDITLRNNHFRNVFTGFHLDLGILPTVTNRLEDTFCFENNLVEFDPRLFPAGDSNGSYGWRVGFSLLSNCEDDDYAFNRFVINSNVFQFTDQSTPEAGVYGATSGGLYAFRTAELIANFFVDLPPPIIAWNSDSAFFEQQADVIDPTNTVPVFCQQNTSEKGTIVEPYPYVLDASLPRPVITAGDAVSFSAPVVGGVTASVVSGPSSSVVIDPEGVFHWQSSRYDAGRYVMGFQRDTNRTVDSRYTLVTVLPQGPSNSPCYFADGLVGYWKLDEGSGQTFQDSSGNGKNIDCSFGLSNQLLQMGVPGNAPGKRAAEFTNSPVTIEAVLVLRDTNSLFRGMVSNYFSPLGTTVSLYHPFTFSFWFKVNTEPEDHQLLFSDGGLWIGVGPGANPNGKLAAVDIGDGQQWSLATPETLSVGIWHHIAVVYDGISDKIYADGVKAAENAVGQFADCSASVFMVAGGNGKANFVGSMCEVALWDRVLSDAEISRLRSDQSSSKDPSTVPLAPSDLAAQPVSAGLVSLTWQDNSLNESGFVLQRSTDNSHFTNIANLATDTTNYLDSLADTNGTYFYRVAAFNEFGVSDYSPVAIVGPCHYDLDSTGTNIGAAAMSGSFNVIGTLGCPWAAVVSNGCDWIQTTSTGQGTGAVNYSVSSNVSSATRYGSITVAEQTYVISQTRAVQATNSAYSALLVMSTNAAPTQAGAVRLTTTTKGPFTGTLQIGAKSYSLRGKLDLGGQARVTIKRSGLAPLKLALQVGPDDCDLISGTVDDGTWGTVFNGSRALADGQSNVALQQGRYTLVLPGQAGAVAEPSGDSFATLTVDKAGRVSLGGELADGTSISWSGLITKSAQSPLYIPLYGGQGYLAGLLDFATTNTNSLGGTLLWVKLATPKAKFYPAGFTFEPAAIGSHYTCPRTGTPVLALSSGQVILSGGNLSGPLGTQVEFGDDDRVVDQNGNQLSLSFTPSSGLFHGTALNPVTGKGLSICGVVLQESSFGSGFFRSAEGIGHAYVGP